LTQLMLKHVNAGLPDCRGKEHRTDLLRAGVDLNCVGNKRHGPRRWHIKYANVALADAKERSSTPMSIVEESRIRSLGVATWMKMPAAQQALFRAQHPCFDEDDDDEDCLVGTEVCEAQTSAWQKRLGSRRWPVNPAHIVPTLDARLGVSTTSHRSGVRSRFCSSIRHDCRKRCLVQDKGSIPDTELVLAVACHQLHPGLCVSADAEIYELCIAIAKYIERHFVKELKGHFHLLHGFALDGAIAYSDYMYLAHVRRRDRIAPTTHMFSAATLWDHRLVIREKTRHNRLSGRRPG